MTIEEAIELLKDNYEYAKQKKFIRDPLVWALFTTLKMSESGRKYDKNQEEQKWKTKTK